MRVTDQQMYTSLSRQVAQRWEQLAKIQEQVASGKRINKPSDDPNAADRVGAMEATLCKLSNCQRASTAAKNLLEITESTLAEASGLMVRAKELAVQTANDVYDAEARAHAALEVRALFDQLRTLGNTEVGERYIFAGFLSDSPPFQSDGSYVGDGVIPELEVSPGLMVEVAVSGEEAFTGGVDLFSCLDALATALETDDTTAIQTTMTDLDLGLEQLSSARAGCGASLQTLVMSESWNGRLRIGLETDLGRLRDTDISRAAMELAMAQQALEATLATAPAMMAQSILDRM